MKTMIMLCSRRRIGVWLGLDEGVVFKELFVMVFLCVDAFERVVWVGVLLPLTLWEIPFVSHGVWSVFAFAWKEWLVVHRL